MEHYTNKKVMKKIIVLFIYISCVCSLNAQITIFWKNGVISTYIDAVDSLVFEENVDLSKYPPQFSSVNKKETEDNYIFSVEIKNVINVPITYYGWEIADNKDFNNAISVKDLKDVSVALDNKTLKLTISKEYTKESLLNKYLRAYASLTDELSYSQDIYISEEFLRLKWDGSVSTVFSGGNGTSIDPYTIADGSDLALISKYPDKYYILINDIDLNNINWTPISKFRGSFDGNNKTIKNLSISLDADKVGLFAETTPESKVKQLNIESVNINCPASSYVGAIAGVAAGNYSSCNVDIKSGSIVGNENVGGMFGQILHDGSYKECFSFDNCRVASEIDKPHILGNSIVGGFAGSTSVRYYNYVVNISNISTSSSLKGQKYIGGMFGKLQSYVYLDQSKTTCNLIGEENIGGIAGEISTTVESKCLISSCISDCNIEGENRIGGFAGTLGCFPIVSSYSKGKIISTGKYVGGFIGYNEYVYQSSTKIVCCYSSMNLPSQAAGFSGYVERSITYNNCYTNSQKYYNDKGYGWQESSKLVDCKNSCQNQDIVNGISESSSPYANNYNLNSQWIWSGVISGSSISLSCPKLNWE